MRFFGEYLVEKNILSTDQMIAALITQTNGIPTVAEIVHMKKLINAQDLMSIFKIQHENKSSFVEAAREIGVWNDQVQSEIDRHIQTVRVPIAQIIDDLKFAKIETIAKAFDEFLGEVQSNSTKKEAPRNEVIVPAAAPAPEPVPAKSNFDSYCALFTEEKKQGLVQALEQLKTGGVSVAILGTLNSNLNALVNAAEVVTAKESFGILTSMNAIISQLGKIPATSLNDELITKIGKVNLDAVELLWKFAQFLKTGKSDSVAVQDDPELKKEYEKVSGGVELTRFDLDFLV